MKEEKANKPISEKTPAGKADWQIIAMMAVLLVFGLIILYSVTSYEAQVTDHNSMRDVIKQLKCIGVGLVGFLLATFLPIDVWNTKLSLVVYIAAIISVFGVLTSLGIEANGAKRWIDLKIFSLQPAEVVKVALILVLAMYICKHKDKLGNPKEYCCAAGLIVAATGFVGIITDDLGTAIIIFGIGIVMLSLVVPNKKFIGLTLAVAVAAGVILVCTKSYRLDRIKAWWNVEDYADDLSYQIMQAFYAIGNGGLFGKGLGKSTQKMGYVPESENDMIFSIIVEELGIIGGLALLALFLFLLIRLWKIYRETDDPFGKLVVAGVIAHIGLQTFVNTAVVTGLIPNTGVTLPFISNGGSSIIMSMTEMGLVMAVCRKRSIRKKNETQLREDTRKGVIYYQ